MAKEKKEPLIPESRYDEHSKPAPEMAVRFKVYRPNQGVIQALGWGPGYFEFSYGKAKGSVTLGNGTVNVNVSSQFIATLDLSDLIEFALEEWKRHGKPDLGKKTKWKKR